MTSSRLLNIQFFAIKFVSANKSRFDQTKVSWGIYRKLSLIINEKLFYWGKINEERNLMKNV